jgi:shikimate dehydrogenase
VCSNNSGLHYNSRMTDSYAVIGNPIDHSKSPQIHAAFAAQTSQLIDYKKIFCERDAFEATVKAFRDAGGKGLNVTVPFKREAWDIVNRHVGYAQDANAVNTIKFADGQMLGYNTDGVGLVRDIKNNLQQPIKGKRLLLLGAGGAAHGVLRPLLEEQPAHVVIANRTLERAKELTAHFATVDGRATSSVSAQTFDGFDGQQFDIIINATSAGLTDAMPALPATIFAPGALAYDMVYGKTTPFMAFAREHGATTVDGLGMLVEQAAESFFIWREVRPQTAPVIALLRG